MSEPIQNKVATAALITLDLQLFKPAQPVKSFDLAEHLFMGLILKEKDFREALKTKDWEEYKDQYVAITCTVDAIIPVWAYMLVSTYLQPLARDVYVGSDEEFRKHIFLKNITSADIEQYRDQRVVVKGCGDEPIEAFAYAEVTRQLLPVAKSVMYGEPCSTVPVFKRK